MTTVSAVPEPPARLTSAVALTVVPNPCSGGASILFDLPKPGDSWLEVFGVDGRLVARLKHTAASGGPQTLVWHGTDFAGMPVSSGVYYLVLRNDVARRTGRLVRVN